MYVCFGHLFSLSVVEDYDGPLSGNFADCGPPQAGPLIHANSPSGDSSNQDGLNMSSSNGSVRCQY